MVQLARLVAIDPGDEHTGIVVMGTRGLLGSGTYDFDDAVLLMEGETSDHAPVRPDLVVIETFRLYPVRAQYKSFSAFTTVKLIGIVEYLCRRASVPTKMAAPPDINAFWKVRKIPPDDKSRLSTLHEVSAYRIAVWAYEVMRHQDQMPIARGG